MEPATRNFILKENGIFYSQTIVEHAIANQEELLNSIKQKDKLVVPNINFKIDCKLPKSSLTAPVTYKIATYSQSEGTVSVFVKLPCIFFHGANLIRESATDGEGDEHRNYLLLLHNSELYYSSHGADCIDFKEKETPPQWSSSDSEQHYLMLTYTTARSGKIIETKPPFLFTHYPELEASYVPDLPNVYERGDICTGDAYTEMPAQSELAQSIKNSVDNIWGSSWNNDLRAASHREKQYLTFLPNGQHTHKPNHMVQMKLMTQPSASAILDFTAWLNKNKNINQNNVFDV